MSVENDKKIAILEDIIRIRTNQASPKKQKTEIPDFKFEREDTETIVEKIDLEQKTIEEEIPDFSFNRNEKRNEVRNIYICYDRESKELVKLYFKPLKSDTFDPYRTTYRFYPEKYSDKKIRHFKSILDGQNIQYKKISRNNLGTDLYILIPVSKESIEEGVMEISVSKDTAPEYALFLAGQPEEKAKTLFKFKK